MSQKIEANKEEKQKSLKEIQENLDQKAEVIKEETKISERITGKHKQASEGAEQNHPGFKNRSRNN